MVNKVKKYQKGGTVTAPSAIKYKATETKPRGSTPSSLLGSLAYRLLPNTEIGSGFQYYGSGENYPSLLKSIPNLVNFRQGQFERGVDEDGGIGTDDLYRVYLGIDENNKNVFDYKGEVPKDLKGKKLKTLSKEMESDILDRVMLEYQTYKDEFPEEIKNLPKKGDFINLGVVRTDQLGKFSAWINPKTKEVRYYDAYDLDQIPGADKVFKPFDVYGRIDGSEHKFTKNSMFPTVLTDKGWEEHFQKQKYQEMVAPTSYNTPKLRGEIPPPAGGFKVDNKQQGGIVNTTGYTPGYESFNNPYNIIPSGDITMKNTPFDVLAIPNNDKPKIMKPGKEYKFKNSDRVAEIPMMQMGSYLQPINDVLRKEESATISRAADEITKNLSKTIKDKNRLMVARSAILEGLFNSTNFTDIERELKEGYGFDLGKSSIKTKADYYNAQKGLEDIYFKSLKYGVNGTSMKDTIINGRPRRLLKENGTENILQTFNYGGKIPHKNIQPTNNISTFDNVEYYNQMMQLGGLLGGIPSMEFIKTAAPNLFTKPTTAPTTATTYPTSFTNGIAGLTEQFGRNGVDVTGIGGADAGLNFNNLLMAIAMSPINQQKPNNVNLSDSLYQMQEGGQVPEQMGQTEQQPQQQQQVDPNQEMIIGLVEMLRQVKDKANREEIALMKLEELVAQGVQVDQQAFMQAVMQDETQGAPQAGSQTMERGGFTKQTDPMVVRVNGGYKLVNIKGKK